MSDDRLITAIGRIERALSRIEARSGSSPLAPTTRDDTIGQRHQELRERTQAVIDRLDQLLEGAASNGGDSGMASR